MNAASRSSDGLQARARTLFALLCESDEPPQRLGHALAEFAAVVENGIGHEFIDPSSGRTPLLLGCIYGHQQLVAAALANPDARHAVLTSQYNGYYAPHLAAHVVEGEGHRVIMPLLAAAGADLNAYDSAGETPLGIACSYGNGSMIECLLQLGVDPNKVDRDGDYPLHLLADKGMLASVIGLLKAGADVQVRDHDGMTPLHRSRESGVTLALIKHGADVHARDHAGWQPLRHSDGSYGHNIARSMQYLLAEGAEPVGIDWSSPNRVERLSEAWRQAACTLTPEQQINGLVSALVDGHVAAAWAMPLLAKLGITDAAV